MKPLSLAILFFAPALAAQSLVSPAHFTNSEATSSSTTPFGATIVPFRYIGIHDDLQGTARVVTGLALRRDGTRTTVYPGYNVMLDAWCSTAATTSDTPSGTFDDNHGTDKLQVVTNKSFNFPQTEFAYVPSTFAYDMPFDTPFHFGGAAGLCWEVQITLKTNTGNVYHDVASGSGANPAMAVSRFGTGCKLSTVSSAMSASGSSSVSWPSGVGTLIVTGSSGPPSSAISVLVGLDNSQFFGIPLPFQIPGSSGAPSGPCFLYTDVVLMVPSATTASGSSSTNIPVPATPDLHGLRSFEQILALDPAANPLGVVLSNAVNHNWVAPYGEVPVARVYLSGNLGPTGTVNAHLGLVVRFSL